MVTDGNDGAAPEVAASGAEHESTPQVDAGVGGTDHEHQSPAWMSQLPDDLKGNEVLTQFAKLGEMGKAFLDLQGRLERSVEIPGEGASEDQVRDFQRRLGVPETSEGYELPNLDLGVETVRPEWNKEFAAAAHEAGLTKRQAEKVYGFMTGQAKSTAQQYNEARAAEQAATKKALQQEWGNDYEKNLKIANRGAASRGKDFVNRVKAGGLDNNLTMIKMLFDYGSTISDDVEPAGKSSGTVLKSTDPRNMDAWSFDATPGMGG
jgi:hypothetical protein